MKVVHDCTIYQDFSPADTTQIFSNRHGRKEGRDLVPLRAFPCPPGWIVGRRGEKKRENNASSGDFWKEEEPCCLFDERENSMNRSPSSLRQKKICFGGMKDAQSIPLVQLADAPARPPLPFQSRSDSALRAKTGASTPRGRVSATRGSLTHTSWSH